MLASIQIVRLQNCLEQRQLSERAAPTASPFSFSEVELSESQFCSLEPECQPCIEALLRQRLCVRNETGRTHA